MGRARRGEPTAPPSPPPRRLCPLNRSPSRLQLISHVTFYLLSPGASCPRGSPPRAAARRAAPARRGAPAPATLGEAAAGRGALSGPLSTRASGAPRASLGREGGGRGRELALAAAKRPLGPARRRAPKAGGVPCALRQTRGRPSPAGTRAGAPWGEPAWRWLRGTGEPPAPSPCRRACATTRGTPCTWPSWPARRAPNAAS